jgi:hypothetical protein
VPGGDTHGVRTSPEVAAVCTRGTTPSKRNSDVGQTGPPVVPLRRSAAGSEVIRAAD